MRNESCDMNAAERVVMALRSAGRPLKASELAALGLNRMAVKRLADSGVIERSGYGVYALPEPAANPYAAWAAVSLRIPKAVVCMESAAAYHGLTQNMATALHLGVPLNARVPTGETVRVVGMRWPDSMLELGVEETEIDGVPVKVTGPERTLVDMFRYSTYSGSRREASFSVDPETLRDAIVRYASSRFHDSGRLLRDVAVELGCWERLRPLMETVVYVSEGTPVP